MKPTRASLRLVATAALALSLPVFLPAAERGSSSAGASPLRGEAQTGNGQSASDLLGMTVKTSQDERVGKVEDFFVDLSSGRIVGVLLSSGGFLGIGDAFSVVQPSNLRRVSDGELRLDISKEKLAAAPRYDKRDLGDRIRDRWSEAKEDMRARQGSEVSAREPESGSVSDADNTARNRRDRDPSLSVNPLDQSNKRSDIETTARIRSAIIANDRLSTNAKNVKIVTRDGQVTLRGPVASDEEKRAIAEIAVKAAPGRVTNQIEVEAR